MIKKWISDIWIVLKAMENILILLEISCNECIYFIVKSLIIKNHFSKNHKRMKWLKNSKKCKIQLLFIEQLKKYIQIEDNNEMEMNIDNNNAWKSILKMEFEWSMNGMNINDSNDYDDIQLMGAFIVKIRWNLTVKDINRKELIELAKMLIIKDSLHAIILYKR